MRRCSGLRPGTLRPRPALRLSIIVPVLDDAAALRNRGDELRALGHTVHEVIIVDGGSRDGSVEISRDLTRKCFSTDPGRSRQMNEGARRASGDVLLFLHADTRLPEGAPGRIAQALEGADVVWGRFDVRLSGKHWMFRVIEQAMNWRSRFTGIATGDQAIFVHRSAFERAGGLPPHSPHGGCRAQPDAAPPGKACLPARARRDFQPPLAARRDSEDRCADVVPALRLRAGRGPGASASHLLPELRTESLPRTPSLPSLPVNVFTRSPVPGRAKTRLIPALGARRAAELAGRMTRLTLERIVEADLGPVTLWCTPGPDEFLRTLAEEFRAGLRTQCGTDLGDRMHYALRWALDGHPGAVLVGSDCPFLLVEDLRRTRTLLFEGDNQAVLGPAHDGGYYLIATREIDATLFAEIPWGGNEVLELTRRRLQDLGWRWEELDPKHDVDRPQDLVHVAHLLSASGEPSSRTGAGPDSNRSVDTGIGEESGASSKLTRKTN